MINKESLRYNARNFLRNYAQTLIATAITAGFVWGVSSLAGKVDALAKDKRVVRYSDIILELYKNVRLEEAAKMNENERSRLLKLIKEKEDLESINNGQIVKQAKKYAFYPAIIVPGTILSGYLSFFAIPSLFNDDRKLRRKR